MMKTICWSMCICVWGKKDEEFIDEFKDECIYIDLICIYTNREDFIANEREKEREGEGGS